MSWMVIATGVSSTGRYVSTGAYMKSPVRDKPIHAGPPKDFPAPLREIFGVAKRVHWELSKRHLPAQRPILLQPSLRTEQLLPKALALGRPEKDVVGVPADTGAGLVRSDRMYEGKQTHEGKARFSEAKT